ncbi:hypothetical protein [Isoptericola sp. NPDC057191]|uniref:hypothetical protein n=1 Tax=Isoptericola sp. NPDC057191 TaxID=3346041 RepID=UPI0036433237
MTHRDDVSTEMMRTLDRDFRAASGLSERRFYKIFYSHIHAFPLLVLGLNPGGTTDGTDLNASSSFYEHGEHDYVDFRHHGSAYSLAGPMYDLLSATLSTTADDDLRQVPATNVIFRRSQSADHLEMKLRTAAHESAPVLCRILQAVDPRAILLLGSSALEQFSAVHCAPGSLIDHTEVPKILTPNGKSFARLLRVVQAHVTALDRTVPLVTVGHPSRYSIRSEWPSVVDAVRAEFQRLGIDPFHARRCQGVMSPAPAGTEPESPTPCLEAPTAAPDTSRRQLPTPRRRSTGAYAPGTRVDEVAPLIAVCAALGLELEDPGAPWRGYGKVVRLKNDRSIYLNPTNADVRAPAHDVATWHSAGLGTMRPDNERYLRVFLDTLA